MKAEESFRSVATTKEEERMLDYTEGYPSMMIERLTYEDDTIIEYTVSVARGDRFRYRVVLNEK